MSCKYEIGQRVRVNIPPSSLSSWASSASDVLQGQQGTVEKYKPDYDIPGRPAYLVTFDKPIPRVHPQNWGPFTAFWFEPSELQAV